MDSGVTRVCADDRWRGFSWIGLVAWLCLAGAPVSAQRATASHEYDPEGHRWNGLGELVAAAAEAGVTLRTPRRIDVDALDARDALLIVYPVRPPPARSIGAFLRRGGRVALADDFGAGAPLLRRYDIERQPSSGDAPAYRGTPALAIARGDGNHPLSRGVTALVTNHPSALHHRSLPAIFYLGRRSDALVLTGAVAEGRFVALGDPSVLIDNMLAFRGNRRFAQNLVAFLSAGRGGRVYLATPRTELAGEDVEADGSRWATLAHRLDAAEIPPAAMRVLAALVLALLAIAALGSLPRRSPYRAETLLPKAIFGGGYAGHLAFFRERRRNLLYPALAYKLELEQALVDRLGLPPHPLLRDLTRALTRSGMPERSRAALRKLLIELDELARRQDLPPSAPRVKRRTLRGMIDTGERALRWLDEHPSSGRQPEGQRPSQPMEKR